MNNKITLLYCAFLLVISPIILAQSIPEDCDNDLQFLPDFLLENDAGGLEIWQLKGEEVLNVALEQAVQRILPSITLETCEEIIREYLSAWRHGHISISTIKEGVTSTNENVPANNRNPTIKYLSASTALLTIPSFNPSYRHPLNALLEDNRDELEKHSNWIIDVRRNGGGSDSTYTQLLTLFMQNQYSSTETAFLSTPINIEANVNICAEYAPGDKECEDFMNPIIEKMKNTSPGTYVSTSGSIVTYNAMENTSFIKPEKVVVVIGKSCGSSCEEFVLAARQSFNVKVVGHNTYGALDYSNLRPFNLPSGERILMYANSRSTRLPIYPVDVAGIAPDVYIPPPQNDHEYETETKRIQNWLEGNSLAPLELSEAE